MNERVETSSEIVRRDRSFGPVILEVGPAPVRRSAPVEERFAALVRCITFQLLATSSANTIHQRVIGVCGGVVNVDSVLTTGLERLREAGLSRSKAAAMIDVSQRVADERITLRRHGRMSDDKVVTEVTAAHGVGPWTAQMYLMHTLGRRDVWPAGDFGVRNGWSLIHDLDKMISEKELRERGETFVGLRSDVAWYCWQAVHLNRANQ